MIFKVYGITDCPSCLRAIADLMEHYPEKEYIFIETDFSKSYRKILKQKFSWSTFPIITTLDEEGVEELIGGYDDLCYLLDKENREPT